MPHILREVGAAWLQDTGDLVPAHADRMTAHYQVKGGVAEGQVSDGVIHSHHADAQGCEITPRYLDVRRPRFRRHQDRRRGRYRRQDLTAARLKVERCRIGHLGQLSHPLAKHPRVTPRWPLLHGAALKPGEIPAVHWHGRAFRHEIIKAGHARHAPSSPVYLRSRWGLAGDNARHPGSRGLARPPLTITSRERSIVPWTE